MGNEKREDETVEQEIEVVHFTLDQKIREDVRLNVEFELISLNEAMQKAQSRIDVLENTYQYSRMEHQTHNDWFEFETRMREMIAEMMGPTLERTEYSKELVLTNNDLVHKLRVELTDLRSDFQKVTIKDFELMRTKVLEKLHERFQQQAHEFINLQGKLKEEYNKNFSKIQDVE